MCAEPDVIDKFERERLEKRCFNSVASIMDTYKPSNYQQNEINAWQSQLDGESEGWWTFTDEERQEIENALTHYEGSYERALDYEEENGFNPDGTKKWKL